MNNKTYQVIDPKGVLVGGKRIGKGEPLPDGWFTGSQLAAWKRFGQVKEAKAAPVKEPTKPEGEKGDTDPKPDPKKAG